jgi:hypothetical protein
MKSWHDVCGSVSRSNLLVLLKLYDEVLYAEQLDYLSTITLGRNITEFSSGVNS